MEKYVLFGDVNSYSTLGMILSKSVIAPAVRKTIQIDIPFRNGKLDITDAYGEFYESRTHKFTFLRKCNVKDRPLLQSTVETLLNGRKTTIKMSDDTFTWNGRTHVESVEQITNEVVQIVIAAECDPYKYDGTRSTL